MPDFIQRYEAKLPEAVSLNGGDYVGFQHVLLKGKLTDSSF